MTTEIKHYNTILIQSKHVITGWTVVQAVC